jgi:RES domain-containing protein
MLPEARGPETEIKTRQVVWGEAWRIIASRFPPINLYERVSDKPQVWEALIELEQLTNPRLRDEVGAIHLVPPERRVAGPNASWVMAPFTHINVKGSRFSDGTYGIYYAAAHLDTAIRETVHHFSKFASDSNDPPRREDMRVLLGSVNRALDDVVSLEEETKATILDKDSYAHSRPFGISRRNDGSDGLVYPSVRHEGGECIAAFWPDAVGIPVQERHLNYEWDGRCVARYFDYQLEQWISLAEMSHPQDAI